jgi:hypothetical protein
MLTRFVLSILYRLKLSSEFSSAHRASARRNRTATPSILLYDKSFTAEVNDVCEMVSTKIMSLFMEATESKMGITGATISKEKFAQLMQIVQSQEAEIKSQKKIIADEREKWDQVKEDGESLSQV